MRKLPRKTFRDRFPEPETRSASNWESWLPTPSLSGVTVTPDTALSLTAVYACVNVIASNLASLPFEDFERLDDGGRKPVYDSHQYDLINVHPNEEMSPFAFWEGMAFNAVLHGNGMAEIERDPWSGEPLAFHLLDSTRTEVKRSTEPATRGLIYYEAAYVDEEKPPQRLLQENVLHVKNLSGNGIVGLSPISVAREAVSSHVAAEKMGAAAMGNAHMISGVIETPNEMNETARKNYREGFSRVHMGPYNAYKIAFVEQGDKFIPLKMNLADYQYLEYRKWAPEEIARLFGVPPHKIAELTHATYSNIEEQNLEFAMGTLRLWCCRIASEVNTKLYTRQERRRRFSQHNMNALMRGNAESLSKWLTSIFGLGGYTINNILQETGQNPIGPAGDRRFVSAQLVELVETGPKVNPVELPTDQENVAEPVGPAPSTDPAGTEQLLNSVRRAIHADVARATTKEMNAVRRAAKRPDFDEWAGTFYSDHRDFLAGMLGPSLETFSLASGKPVSPSTVASSLAEASLAQLRSRTPELDLTTWSPSHAPILDQLLCA